MLQYVDKITDLIAPQVEGLEKDEIRAMIEIPADSKMGDYAFPCFKLAKILRKAPPMIAKGIAEAIADDPMFAKVEQVNAYVNMFIAREAFADVMSAEAAKDCASLRFATAVFRSSMILFFMVSYLHKVFRTRRSRRASW